VKQSRHPTSNDHLKPFLKVVVHFKIQNKLFK